MRHMRNGTKRNFSKKLSALLNAIACNKMNIDEVLNNIEAMTDKKDLYFNFD